MSRTTGSEAGEVWSDNGGYDLYHASLSLKAYETLLKSNHLSILIHKVNDPDCGDATVWIAQK